MSPLVIPNQISAEGKTQDHHVFDILEYFSLSKECIGIGWLLLTALEKVDEEKNKVIRLGFQIPSSSSALKTSDLLYLTLDSRNGLGHDCKGVKGMF